VGKTTRAIRKVLVENAELLRQVLGVYVDREKAAMRSASFRCARGALPTRHGHTVCAVCGSSCSRR
jgi:hypothetical protein